MPLTRRDVFGVLIAIIAVNAIGAAPSLLFGADTNWFEKPWFYPPEYLFGIVWTVLFTLKGIALYLVIRNGLTSSTVQIALLVFALQFMLNLLWTPIFFGLQRPDISLAVIVALLVAILGTILAFAQVDRRAAWLLAPYLLWTVFATALNGAITIG